MFITLGIKENGSFVKAVLISLSNMNKLAHNIQSACYRSPRSPADATEEAKRDTVEEDLTSEYPETCSASPSSVKHTHTHS